MKTFSDRVVEIAMSIPKGKVTTYGRISRAAGGGAMSSQSITGILGKAYKEKGNIGFLQIPFHRIVYADGSIWVDETHYKKRMKLYKEEGIEITKNNKIKNFRDIVIEFT
jgi:methylated-DNA-protein-cysteine methyltransferase-like protein